jgi:hypothetical protein
MSLDFWRSGQALNMHKTSSGPASKNPRVVMLCQNGRTVAKSGIESGVGPVLSECRIGALVATVERPESI